MSLCYGKLFDLYIHKMHLLKYILKRKRKCVVPFHDMKIYRVENLTSWKSVELEMKCKYPCFIFIINSYFLHWSVEQSDYHIILWPFYCNYLFTLTWSLCDEGRLLYKICSRYIIETLGSLSVFIYKLCNVKLILKY